MLDLKKVIGCGREMLRYLKQTKVFACHRVFA